MSPVAPAVPAAVGFYGKIPAERDFVRVNAGAFLRAGLDRWFQEGVERLQRARLPVEPACFLLSPAAGVPPFVGVLAPGEDAIGRAFPVVIFAALDQPPHADFSLLPLRLASFCEAAARLASRVGSPPALPAAYHRGRVWEPFQGSHVKAAHALTTGQLAAEIDALASGIRPVVQVLDVNALLLQSSCSDLCAALGGSCEAAAYALTTLIAACTQARQPHSRTRVLVLDCPAPTDELRTLWLELVRRHLGEAQMPSLLWTRESGRLLIALGPAPSLMLAYLADPDHHGSRCWPLRTHVARANALEQLSRPASQVLASATASLADVLHVFS